MTGLLLATIGMDSITGYSRFIFGNDMFDGRHSDDSAFDWYFRFRRSSDAVNENHKGC